MIKTIILGITMLIMINSPTKNVTVTCYHPVKAQTSNEYWITASNKTIDTLNPLKHRWIAVSRDLEQYGYVFGAKVKVTGTKGYDGVWTVEDRMNRRWTNKIDLLIGEDDAIGKWDNVELTLIN